MDVIELRVPDIGESQEIELVTWYVVEGDQVRQGQELCELVTDKAAFPLESPYSGCLKAILVTAGTKVNVGDLLALLDT